MIAALVFAAAAQPAQSGNAVEPIVVTGERIGDLRQRLAACLARHCPTDEDVDATLALAEGQFLNGDYDEAAADIRASLRRNAGQAAAFPEPVADLYRSYARVEWHLGRDADALRATHAVLETLRDNIRQEDHRHFTARLEYVAALTKAHRLELARTELQALERVARAARREDVARLAGMRLLLMDAMRDQTDHGPPIRRLEAMARDNSPAARVESVTARLFLARLYRARGDIARSNGLLASVPRDAGDRRMLIYDPPFELSRADATGASGSVTRLLPDNHQDTWIDVSYWIGPDGRVNDVDVVRQGAGAAWAAPLLRSIAGRRYSPSSDPTPSYRLERYTFTAPYDVVTGSRIPQRSRNVRVEYVDLTAAGETGRAPDSAVGPH